MEAEWETKTEKLVPAVRSGDEAALGIVVNRLRTCDSQITTETVLNMDDDELYLMLEEARVQRFADEIDRISP